MPMLAEKKRKTKWFINSTKKPLWNTDTNGIKFGKELMEKMGWSVGEGLGVNRQGIQEPLKVSYKSDTKGIGFKENDDEWIEQQDEFNSFLNQLRNSDESVVVKTSDIKKDEVKSLEEKSKLSKARLHYQKFTRGKDLSKYSENDLACILGTKKAKKEKSTTNEVVQEGPEANDNFETHFGVKTINSGSIKDYFKKKWVSHKKLTDTCDAVDEETQNYQSGNFYSSTQEEENIIEKDKKKPKRKKLELNSDGFVNIETTMSFESNELEQIENKKKRKKKKEKDSHLEEEPEIKKRKRNYDFEVDHDSTCKDIDVFVAQNKDDDCNLENTNNNVKNILKVDNVNVKNELKNQKKRKKEKKEGDTSGILGGIKVSCSEENNSEKENNVFEEKLITKKKKKKSKKEKHFENYDKVSLDASDSTLNNQKSFVKEEFKYFENYNDQRVNSGFDEDNVENTNETGIKKKKKNKKEKLIEAEEIDHVEKVKSSLKKEVNKDTSEIEFCDLELSVKKRKKRDKREKSNEKEIVDNTNEIEVISEVELIEKKKKKDKREKSIEKEGDKKTDEVEDISEVEFVKKEKKKNKEEKLVEKKIDINTNIVEVIPEVELVAKKKYKKENSAEKESDKKTNEVEVISEVEFVKKKKKRDKREKSNEKEIDDNTNTIEDTSEVEFVKKEKKKKRDKKEKSNEKESDKQTNEVEVIPEVELVAKKKNKKENPAEKESDKKTNEVEVTTEVEFIKKKKKKKSKKENSIDREEIESLTNDENNINNPSVRGNKSKKYRQDTPEIEFVKTKKMKKSKKEKSLKTENSSIEITDELEVKEENIKVTYERKPSPVLELFKEKLKKEKGKIIKEEEVELLDDCTNSIKPRSEKDKNEIEDISEAALVSKKKKKKDKIKEILNESNSESFLQIEKSNCKIEQKNSQGAELLKEKKTINGFHNHQNNHISNNFSYSYNYHNNKGVLIKNRADGEYGIQNPMKEEFLNDKRADKFYPGRNKTQKVLRLLYLSDFNEFKGSNIKKMMGYGVQINQR